jgi:hypothetical protein
MAHSLNLSKVGRSNGLHSAAEEAVIQQALIAAEQARITTEQKLAELTDQVTRYKIALAPHKKLPEDVLREIFNLVCHDQILSLEDEDENNDVIQLSHVCSAWRRVALNIPRLWADVNICLCDKNKDVKYKEDCNVRLVQLWPVEVPCPDRSMPNALSSTPSKLLR